MGQWGSIQGVGSGKCGEFDPIIPKEPLRIFRLRGIFEKNREGDDVYYLHGHILRVIPLVPTLCVGTQSETLRVFPRSPNAKKPL